jgi:replicative DNA helicase
MNNQKNITNYSECFNFKYGKISPSCIDVEEAVIGAMILERDCFINNPVKKEWFYKEEHQKIISCIEELVNESIPIDLIQVTTKLKNKGLLEEIGGPLHITQLTNKIALATNINSHIRIIKDTFARREVIRIGTEMVNKAYDESIDIDDLFSFIQNEISGAMSYDTEDSSTSYKDATSEVVEVLTTEIEQGIKTGLTKFDTFSGGLQNSDLIIIAGETSQGKTSNAITIVKNCAKNGLPSAVYSLEMPQRQLVARITAQETGISAKKIMYNNLSKDQKSFVLEELNRMNNLPIYFDENSNNDIDKICTSIRKLKIKHNIGLVLVDYIQDMKGADTEAGVAEIGRKLKNIAKEINIPIIAISQLARDKTNPEPRLSRLRGSGQLEEKADVILLIYRPEYYGKEYSEPFEDVETNGTAQIDIAKGRNIGIGRFILRFNKETTNFYDYENREIPEEQISSEMPTINFYEPEKPEGNNDIPF